MGTIFSKPPACLGRVPSEKMVFSEEERPTTKTCHIFSFVVPCQRTLWAFSGSHDIYNKRPCLDLTAKEKKIHPWKWFSQAPPVWELLHDALPSSPSCPPVQSGLHEVQPHTHSFVPSGRSQWDFFVQVRCLDPQWKSGERPFLPLFHLPPYSLPATRAGFQGAAKERENQQVPPLLACLHKCVCWIQAPSLGEKAALTQLALPSGRGKHHARAADC